MSTVPRVWCNFSVKTNKGDVKLRIQDAPTDRLEDVAHLFATYFAAEETFHKIAEIVKNKEAQEECKNFVLEMMKDSKVTICCLDNDPNVVGEIIAASIITLERKDDPDEDIDIKTKTKEMERMFELMMQVFDMYNAMKELKLDSFYDDRGIVVHPDYRGHGIAQKLFHNRRVICTEEAVPMTGAWVTSFGSQKAAERDGWETIFEVSYEELGKKFGITFKDVPPTCKFMAAKGI